MKEKFIALIDSGIGGLATLKECIKIMPQERYLYLGDNDNAPYGNRTERDLLALTLKNIEDMSRYGIKALVLACNTLSTTILHKVECYAGVKTFGVFPPLESCVMNGEKTLLCATPVTAARLGGIKGVDVLPLKGLAKDVERHKYDLSQVNIFKHLKDISGHENGQGVLPLCRYDTLILGCTHYELIKKQFFDHLRPLKIKSGSPLTAMAVKNFLQKTNSIQNISKYQVNFIGNCAEENYIIFNLVGNGYYF